MVAISCCAFAVASCTSGPSLPRGSSKSKEYFAESEYGVKASPRVTNQRTRLKRGGGRDMIGKPYKIRGRWYKPKEEPGYRKVGAASWYGDAFHGRLTANGEIYDMTHLTAAHPTMPLPSYARVTNVKNGSSVIVRVNDRGPFAHDRVIDLSKRAAEMLDYTHAGVARVEVEYLGRAPLHGQDDGFLLASYRPGGASGPALNDGLPAGVMIAMNGSTPTSALDVTRRAFGGQATVTRRVAAPEHHTLRAPAGAAPVQFPPPQQAGFPAAPTLPATGAAPVPPGFPAAPVPSVGLPVMSYAQQRIDDAAGAVGASWKRMNGFAVADSAPEGEYVAAGSFRDPAQAEALARRIGHLGSVRLVAEGDAFSVAVGAGPGGDVDLLANELRSAGAHDAFVVRN